MSKSAKVSPIRLFANRDPGTLLSTAPHIHKKTGDAMEFPGKVVKAQLGLGAELLLFFSRRIKAQASFLHFLTHPGDVSAIFKHQSEFMDMAAEDYARELNRFTDIAQRNFETFGAFTKCDD